MHEIAPSASWQPAGGRGNFLFVERALTKMLTCAEITFKLRDEARLNFNFISIN